MVVPGPTTTKVTQRWAGNLLREARSRQGWSLGQLASAAGVPTSSVARIEAGTRQPSLLLLARLLAASDLEMRIRLETYDDHDDALDARDADRTAGGRATAEGRHDQNVELFAAAGRPESR